MTGSNPVVSSIAYRRRGVTFSILIGSLCIGLATSSRQSLILGSSVSIRIYLQTLTVDTFFLYIPSTARAWQTVHSFRLFLPLCTPLQDELVRVEDSLGVEHLLDPSHQVDTGLVLRVANVRGLHDTCRDRDDMSWRSRWMSESPPPKTHPNRVPPIWIPSRRRRFRTHKAR